ncbi:GatB/YqeY domain-containing protein [Cellulosimicrobium funkei]|nr:GatB/YqeY domain-containing protein [Cellulosimicrobium funkei]
MTTLKNRLRDDTTTALKSGDKLRLSTLRGVLGEIETREKSGKTPLELDDAQVEALLRKEATKRHETADIYTQAGEAERAAQEKAEALVIEAYLPQMLTEGDVVRIIDEAIAEFTQQSGEAPTMRQMGQVMKPVTAEIAGRFDGKQVAGLVKARLG